MRAEHARRCLFEAMEPRQLLAANPLVVGAVFIEEDLGSDGHGDTFEITFHGGAAGTQLTRLEIRTDQSPAGFGEGDLFFDTAAEGLGADHAFPFTLVAFETQDPGATVQAEVQDGGTLLTLHMTGFRANDKLIFSIDVDEVEDFDSSQTDLAQINEGIDPITSGVEFQGTLVHALFVAPRYHEAQVTSEFRNYYDSLLNGSGLNLPADDAGGKRDRSAGAIGQGSQVPLPVAIAGTVYLETNLDLIQQSGEPGLEGVELSLWQKIGDTYQPTGHRTTTDASGHYEFGLELNLLPGTYQVREEQPDQLFSVGAIPGTIDGMPVGIADDGEPDVLSEIVLELGEQRAEDYDFAEARAAELQGYVFHDRDNDSRRDAGEEGIAGVPVRLVPLQTLAASEPVTVTTDASGAYRATGLVPGSYRVVQVQQPDGYFDGKDSAGTVDGSIRGNAQSPGDSIENVFLGGGQVGREYNFGELVPASLQGHVRLADADGNCDAAGDMQRPVDGAVVRLLDATGRQLAETTTDGQGAYRFDDLWPGTYSIVEITPAGLINGRSHIGRVDGIAVGQADTDSLVDIVIASGQVGTGYDFCEYEPASLAGRVYHDRDNDGAPDPGEEGLAGVDVLLLDDSGNQITATVTDAEGNYAFHGLRAGEYKIVERQPDGWLDGIDRAGTVAGSSQGRAVNPGDSIEQVRLRWGEAGVDYLFAELRYSSIEGNIHLATPDGDCFVETDQLRPLAGVTVLLQNDQGTTIAQTQSDAGGQYRFDGLLPGVYRLVEQTPAGLLDGAEHVGTIQGVSVGRVEADSIRDVRIASDQAAIDYDFCEYEPASLSGFVYHDLNNDGSLDTGEPPIAGVTVRLLDSAGQTVASTTTQSDGSYRFTMLSAGTYTLIETQPDGYLDGRDSAGTIAGVVMGVAVNPGDEIDSIRLRWGDEGQQYDFGELQTGSIAGRVHADRDGDCRLDEGETPLADVVLELRNEQGAVVATTRTDSRGEYRFDGLAPGRYSLNEIQPEGYFQGGQRAGSGGGDASAVDVIRDILLQSSQELFGYDFCEIPPSNLSGQVYSDPNQNCRLDNDETALAGVTIRLLDSNGRFVAATTTDASGRYRFENLPPGRYAVQQIQPAGLFSGSQRAGSHGGDVSVANAISRIVIPAGETAFGYDFCELPPGEFSGYVFQDGEPLETSDGRPPADARSLRDGQRTPDDTPLAGVTLELLDAGTGEPIRGDSSRVLPGIYEAGPITAVTDSSGYYRFPGLLPGRYAVHEIQPALYTDGVDTPGTFSATLYGGNTDPKSIAPWIVPSPSGDADVLLVAVSASGISRDNNFSEILVRGGFEIPITYEPVTPPAPTVFVDAPAAPPPAAPWIVAAVPPPALDFGDFGVGGTVAFSWHLSIIDAGSPRGRTNPFRLDDLVWRNTAFRPPEDWNTMQVTEGYWTLHTRGQEAAPTAEGLQRKVFGMRGAVPVAADFNGDGVDELGVYYRGRWLLDLNGNGVWDDEDLWAQLGGEFDLPICGDWNGDGKDDIGIFGPAWAGDYRTLQVESGLPDMRNRTVPVSKPKNVPPDHKNATDGFRFLQHTMRGQIRADVIDHVFRYGGSSHVPVSGDWTGDGIQNIGVFDEGRWRLDADGNGRWSQGDWDIQYGREGDLPVVGDFDGNGIDDIGVYRAGQWILDLDGNRHLDAHDYVFQFGTDQDIPVAGDWNGDGIDDPAIYTPADAAL